jgi:hypothetical protein
LGSKTHWKKMGLKRLMHGIKFAKSNSGRLVPLFSSIVFHSPNFDAVQKHQQTHILHTLCKKVNKVGLSGLWKVYIPPECAGLFILSCLFLSKASANPLFSNTSLMLLVACSIIFLKTRHIRRLIAEDC